MATSSGLRPSPRPEDCSGEDIVNSICVKIGKVRLSSCHLLGSGCCIYSLAWLRFGTDDGRLDAD